MDNDAQLNGKGVAIVQRLVHWSVESVIWVRFPVATPLPFIPTINLRNTMEKCPTKVMGFNGSFKKLASAISDMRYDKVEIFLRELAQSINRQAEGDKKRNRLKLSTLLAENSAILKKSADKMAEIWRLCQPHMKK